MDQDKDHIKDIESFFKIFKNKFPLINFKYDFNSISNTYRIHVTPEHVYENCNEYMKLEFDFTNYFEDKYPNYLLLFVSDHSLNKLV